MSAHTGSVSNDDDDAAGRLAIGIWYRTVWWAVDELVAKLAPEQLRKLRVRAGEHLAAILTTTFLRTAPAEVDTKGGVDLWFDQLQRKISGDGTSMNVFLVVHPLDYFTAESFRDYVIGPYLEPLEDIGDLDTVWVLWPPHHLTVWSRERHEWINLLFELMNPDEEPTELPVLQDAEQEFLTRIGHTDPSPYYFMATYQEEADPEFS